jgi:hypothetical protein
MWNVKILKLLTCYICKGFQVEYVGYKKKDWSKMHIQWASTQLKKTKITLVNNFQEFELFLTPSTIQHM